MVEELRGIMADRFVLTLINKKMIGKDAFDRKENGAVFLNETGRREFLSAWQKKSRRALHTRFWEKSLNGEWCRLRRLCSCPDISGEIWMGIRHFFGNKLGNVV